MNKLQNLQNKAIKFITKNDPEEMSIKRSHEKYKIEAYNTRLHRRGQKIWEKLCIDQPDLTNRSRNENQNNNSCDHYWWKRIGAEIENETPEPIYVYQHLRKNHR